MSNSDDEHYGEGSEYRQIRRHYRQLKRHRDNLRLQRNILNFLSRQPPPPPPEMFDMPPADLPFNNFMESVHEHLKEKFNELGLEIQRIQLPNFFYKHKDEEWFRIKYHPDDRVIEKQKRTMALKKRLDVFKEFLANGKVDSVSVDAENPGPLVHLLDSVIIKLEGGTDFDLTVLSPIKTFKFQQGSKHEKKQTNKKTNVDENSDYKVDYNEKDEVEKIKKYKVNKTDEAMDVDVQKPVIFNITFNNDQNDGIQPRALHCTNSLFLQNLPPTLTKSELEIIFKQFTGFRRLHIDDPTPQHLWHRHGWVVFDEGVRINDIFQNLQHVTLGDNKLDVTNIKTDLKDRIRSVNGITNHFQVARNDMKLCVSIINYLDNRSGLWQSTDSGEPAMENTYGTVSRNPVLHNILDFIIDEASAEEEELLGECVPFESEVNTEKHIQLLKALDRMLLYLRIVHSVDFYDSKEYANEDDMPCKCHIMHARRAPIIIPPTDQEISDYCHNFQTKVNSSIMLTHELSEIELIELGAQDEEEEIEKFITFNTIKFSNYKWFCDLSGEKFKSPELVRKHIIENFNEHLNEVKIQVKYFNNYLRDPKRPSEPLPEGI